MSSVVKSRHTSSGVVYSGCQTTHTRGAQEMISMAKTDVLDAVDNIKFKKGNQPFVICDYGTADGGNSLSLITEIIKCVKLKYGDTQPVHIVYEDQMENDFKSLFNTVQGTSSNFYDFKDVYVTASGTNFYEQCLPPGTVHLGLSFTAMHFLSRRPCNLSDSLLHIENKNDTENEKFKKQASEDWEKILLNRAKELAPGGEMIVLLGCIDEMGQWMGKHANIKISYIETITNIWEAIVTKEEFLNTTLNVYFRTEAEIRAPFNDPESAVSKEGLKLIETKVLFVKCPFHKEWIQSEKTKADAVAHAQKLATNQKVWLTSTLISGLSDKRTSEDKEEIVDRFFKKYEDLIAENPQDYFVDYLEMFLHIRKSY